MINSYIKAARNMLKDFLYVNMTLERLLYMERNPFFEVKS